MNVLLVDDDYYVVTALQQKINWASLQIEQVYTAHNIAQAREILQLHTVQILICDIEMPQGSGLELLSWIRGEKYAIQAIFLTNYPDFNYAQKAIELQSFEYFLKPIAFDKLSLIIQKAVARVLEQQTIEMAALEGQLWKKNESKLIEHFWRGLIMDRTSVLKPDVIARAIVEHHLAYHPTDFFLPILFHLFPYDESLGQQEKALFDFAFLNVAHEIMEHHSFVVEAVVEYKAYNWIAILKMNQSGDAVADEPHTVVDSICSSFVAKAGELLKSDACCSIAVLAGLERIHGVLQQLININEETVKRRNIVFHLDHYQRLEAEYNPPDLSLLDSMLQQDHADLFLGEASRYMDGLVHDQIIPMPILSSFRLDMMQLVYAFLKGKEIQVHRLYSGRTNDKYFAQSLNSLEDMQNFLAYLVQTAMAYRDFTAEPKTVVEEIAQYIRTHPGDRLTRISLAEIVYLNPDYLARLFKRETGISLGNYIIQIRIQVAEHMLETTHLSLHAIARKVGYANYSHFAKSFKKVTGRTPAGKMQ